MKNEELQFISLAEAARITNYSQDYISLLCRQGKLRAEKLGRNWVTTKDWVYSYIDNTEGKGESIVPVKVKEKKSEENRKSEGHKGKVKKPFFAYNALECALFCFAFLIWSINIYLVNNLLQVRNSEVMAGYNQAASANQNKISNKAYLTNASESACGVDDSYNGCEACGSGRTVQSLDSFAKETDAAIIASRKQEITEKFGTGLEMEIYKTFAVLKEKSDPEKSYLYMFEK